MRYFPHGWLGVWDTVSAHPTCQVTTIMSVQKETQDDRKQVQEVLSANTEGDQDKKLTSSLD